ncbi:myeloid-associated differentiation marker-like [Chanos chanos]|uniref:Myeloid-associated differentiation marker-like n=1 Tax=Chanos chanos TaxID=29144 RepID=A0A6J2WS50_CHACN|nr:myeloid-associated differentiation marker-like [Chanos chanos]
MVTVDTSSLTVPVGILRIVEVVLSCVTFSLVASAGHVNSSYWAWCMFTWCFCCFVTLIIIILELTSLSARAPISWNDFTTAFAMLATLMVLSASVIYSVFISRSASGKNIAAAVISFLCFLAYAVEVSWTRARPGEISGFLATVPGLLKVVETFVACIIFISLGSIGHGAYSSYPGLQWCVAVYSICFIFALIIIILTIGRMLPLLPFPFDKVLTGYNVLAVLMYMTAVVIWPLYSYENNAKRSNDWAVVTAMTCVNLIAYIVDTIYSVRLVFFITPA